MAFSQTHDIGVLRKYLLTAYDGPNKTHILKTNRFLLASLHALLKCQENVPDGTFAIHTAFGALLGRVCDLVSRFYQVYDDLSEDIATALKYQTEWERTSPRLFRQYINKKKRSGNWKEDGHNDLFKSGCFFPHHHQLRPGPFNGLSDFKRSHRYYGPCSKHYG